MNATTTKPKRITATERKRLATERYDALMEWGRLQQERDIARGVLAPLNGLPDDIIEICYFGVWTVMPLDFTDGIRRPKRIQGTLPHLPFTRYNPDMDGEEWLNQERVRQLTEVFKKELISRVAK
jgi:hypothetical protein